MRDQTHLALTENNTPLNRAALRWLRETNSAAIAPHRLHLLTLAWVGVQVLAPDDLPGPRYLLDQQVSMMDGWKPENVLSWVLTNPNGPARDEQEAHLLNELQMAQTPKQAAALVLNAIWSRQVADNPALQPAASELS